MNSRTSQDLRQDAARWRRRAEDEARWGNADLAPARVRDYRAHADRLDHAADAAEVHERRRRLHQT